MSLIGAYIAINANPILFQPFFGKETKEVPSYSETEKMSFQEYEKHLEDIISNAVTLTD